MNAKALKLFALLALVAVLITVLGAACGGSDPEKLNIPVKVESGKMVPETIKVKQGDMVTLTIEAEEPGEFHLHTYDIEMDIESGDAAEFFFVAEATGRFRITFHPSEEGGEEGEHDGGDEEEEHEEEGEEEGEEIDIGFLEVGPR